MEQFTIESVAGTPEGVRIFRLSGPFTLPSTSQFQSLVRTGDDQITIVDVAAVPYIDSAAIGSVMSFHITRQKLHRKYALVGVGQRLKTSFTVAGVDKILVTYPTTEDALSALCP